MNPMRSLMNDVAAFHRACDVPVLERPTVPSQERIELRVWDEVQAANMRKVAADGKVRRRADGKILKPDGWTPPDVAGVIGLEDDDG